jgi:hypothetical protein
LLFFLGRRKPEDRSQEVRRENQTLEPQRTQRSAEEKPFQPQIFTEYHRFKRNQKLREARGRKSEGKPKMAPLQDGTDFEDLAKWHRAADCNFWKARLGPRSNSCGFGDSWGFSER